MNSKEIQEITKNIPYQTMAIPEDIDSICSLAEKLPKGIEILEIGSLIGKSAIVWSLATEGTVYTIDKEDRCEEIRKNAEKCGAKVIPIVGNSHDIKWDKMIDVVYIDGKHEFPDVIKDIRKFEPFTKTLITGHDYFWGGIPNEKSEVRPVIDNYYEDRNTENIWFHWVKKDKPLITVISLLSERDFCLDEWLKSWEDLDFDKSELNVIWYISGKDKNYQDKLKNWYDNNRGDYSTFELVFTGNDIFRYKLGEVGVEKVDNQILKNYNECKKYIKTKYALFWEDDIIPPKDALKKLLKDIEDESIYSVSGKAHFRPSVGFNTNKLLTWSIESKNTFPKGDLQNERSHNVLAMEDTKSEGVDYVSAIHFGFTLLKSDFVRNYTFTNSTDNLSSSCDIVAGYNISKLGGKCAIDWSILLKHRDIK
jgi:predicted O-methyltransferase YrrM